MAKREIHWKADNATYRDYCDKIVSVKNEQKELGKDIVSIKNNAITDGCDPKVLSAMVKLASMKQSEKDAFEQAMEK